ncbi:glycoside hydrolase superfamily [Lasiosphaeria miniovina]|uniref:mannan endo-1,4-beta-mannosidase n=1 Tax=Lasiosphaeria miniovina TaxID=1954250 RepID=A0AA40DIB8_9PEZI|nr:glycoside hydrolase superfamily [Lasiosphaeria miniovina]KAK0701887.1 glycoside hydrolase superfamily [Lasiosphaeria miniovina]
MLVSALLFLGLGLARADDSFVRSTQDPQIPSVYAIGAPNGSFAKVNGRLFEIDGRTGYFAGTNAWWLGHLTRNEDAKYKIVRVWGFGDVNKPTNPDAADLYRVWYQLINGTGAAFINYGSDGLQRLDYVVHRAEQLGLKLVLPFVNEWPDWGGREVAYAPACSFEPTWYEDAGFQAVYRAYVRVLVTRYRASPAVFSWQLCNEPRCSQCDVSVIAAWAAGVSAYIKSLDPLHMVSLGDEGWFGPTAGYSDPSGSNYAYEANDGVDFVTNLKIPTLDYGVFHLIPAGGAIRMNGANKPVILEEYGSPERGNHTRVLAPWLDTIVKSGLAAEQVWQFGPANVSANSADFGDEFTVYYNSSEFALLGAKHAQDMLDKGG